MILEEWRSRSAHQWPVSINYIQVTCSCRLIIAVVLIASSLNEYSQVLPVEAEGEHRLFKSVRRGELWVMWSPCMSLSWFLHISNEGRSHLSPDLIAPVVSFPPGCVQRFETFRETRGGGAQASVRVSAVVSSGGSCCTSGTTIPR